MEGRNKQESKRKYNFYGGFGVATGKLSSNIGTNVKDLFDKRYVKRSKSYRMASSMISASQTSDFALRKASDRLNKNIISGIVEPKKIAKTIDLSKFIGLNIHGAKKDLGGSLGLTHIRKAIKSKKIFDKEIIYSSKPFDFNIRVRDIAGPGTFAHELGHAEQSFPTSKKGKLRLKLTEPFFRKKGLSNEIDATKRGLKYIDRKGLSKLAESIDRKILSDISKETRIKKPESLDIFKKVAKDSPDMLLSSLRKKRNILIGAKLMRGLGTAMKYASPVIGAVTEAFDAPSLGGDTYEKAHIKRVLANKRRKK